MTDTICLVAFLCLMILCGVGFGLNHRFLYLLRTRFPETWKELGEPSLFWNNSPKNTIATLRFLMRRGYSRLTDPTFVRFCDILRIYVIAYFIFFGITLVLFLRVITEK